MSKVKKKIADVLAAIVLICSVVFLFYVAPVAALAFGMGIASTVLAEGNYDEGTKYLFSTGRNICIGVVTSQLLIQFAAVYEGVFVNGFEKVVQLF